MIDSWQLGPFAISWLEGGVFEIDGGSMFGVVPKVLWEKKCPCTPDNYVQLADSAMLVRCPAGNVLIETGLGNKLSEKQRKIFRLRREWALPAELAHLGLGREDIQHVILTHGDFDHASGTTMLNESNGLELTFPKAIHYIQRQEWEDVHHPNRRSASTYWASNFAGLVEGKNLRLIDGEAEVLPGIRLALSGGHTRGHQVVWLESADVCALHMGDLLPNTAYVNPLWITAYDNYPLDSIGAKEALLAQAQERRAWLLFYHDMAVRACRFNTRGEAEDVVPALYDGAVR